MKYRRTATLASALGLAVLSVGGWIGYQLWQFHAEDSLRAGVTALKNGDYARGTATATQSVWLRTSMPLGPAFRWTM